MSYVNDLEVTNSVSVQDMIAVTDTLTAHPIEEAGQIMGETVLIFDDEGQACDLFVDGQTLPEWLDKMVEREGDSYGLLVFKVFRAGDPVEIAL